MSLNSQDALVLTTQSFTDKDKGKIKECDEKIMKALLKGKTRVECDYHKATLISLHQRGYNVVIGSTGYGYDDRERCVWFEVNWGPKFY